MEMSVLNNFLLNIPLEICMDFLILRTCFLLLREKLNWKKLSVILVPTVLISSFAGVLFFQSGLFYSTYHLGQILSGYLIMALVITGMCLVLRSQIETAFIAGGVSFFIQLSVSLLAQHSKKLEAG